MLDGLHDAASLVTALSIIIASSPTTHNPDLPVAGEILRPHPLTRSSRAIASIRTEPRCRNGRRADIGANSAEFQYKIEKNYPHGFDGTLARGVPDTD
jgi:hypothetical protein